MRGKKKTMSLRRFMFITKFLNRAAVSRALGKNRMYLTDIRLGRMYYSPEVGHQLRKLLKI